MESLTETAVHWAFICVVLAKLKVIKRISARLKLFIRVFIDVLRFC